MKKIGLLALVLLLVCSSVTVFAATDDFYTAMGQTMYAGKMHMEISGCFNEEPDASLGLEAEEVAAIKDSKLVMDVQLDASEDLQVLDMAMTMKMVSGMVSSTVESWIHWDFTNPEQLMFQEIVKNPEDNKYYVMDYVKASTQMDMTVEDYQALIAPQKAEELRRQLSEALQAEGVAPVLEDGVYTLRMEEQQMKNILGIYTDSFVDLFGSSVTTSEVEEMERLFSNLKEISLFAKDAFLLQVTLDEQKQMKDMNMALHVQTNVAEVVEALEGSLNELDPEKADIDFSIQVNTSYSEMNLPQEIAFPELTDENSVNVLEEQTAPEAIPMEQADPNTLSVAFMGYVVPFVNAPYETGDRTMVPLEEFLSGILGSVATKWDGDTVYLGTANGFLFSCTLGSKTATLNGATIEMDVAPEKKDDVVYFPLRFLAENLGMKVDWTPFVDANGVQTGGVAGISF